MALKVNHKSHITLNIKNKQVALEVVFQTIYHISDIPTVKRVIRT